MVFDAMRQMIYYRRHVFSNIPISFTHKGKYYEADYVPTGKEFRKRIFEQRNSIICVDEAAIYFPNFLWNKLPEEVLMAFHEQRKMGCDFYYTSQLAKHAVKRIRDLSYIVSFCYKLRVLSFLRGIGIHTPTIYVTKRFWPAYFEGNMDSAKKYEKYYAGIRLLYPSDSKRVFDAYKTNFIVDTTGALGYTPRRILEQDTKAEKMAWDIATKND